MRFSLRLTVQALLLFTFLLLINILLVELYSEGRNSEAENPGQSGHLLGVREARRLPLERRALDSDDLGQGTDTDSHQQLPAAGAPKNGTPQDGDKLTKPPGSRPGNQGAVEGKGQTPSVAKDYSSFQPVLASAADLSASRPTELYDVFLSVKTTKKFHSERLDLLLETWIPMAREETFIFTDDDDLEYKKKTKGHLINTNCSAVHTRRALCCKMSVEFDYFIASGKRWFCHVDDDTYVNIPALYQLVRQYNHTGNWYLGKPSLTHPLEIPDIEKPTQKTAFWFATGGAGFCISRGLALKMVPFAGGGKLRTVCEKIRLPDDCTIAFIIYYYLKHDLTVIPQFHSHLEGLWMIKKENIETQITFSYSRVSGGIWNVVPEIPGGFSTNQDPSRFRSIHCLLYPNLKECTTNRRQPTVPENV